VKIIGWSTSLYALVFRIQLKGYITNINNYLYSGPKY